MTGEDADLDRLADEMAFNIGGDRDRARLAIDHALNAVQGPFATDPTIEVDRLAEYVCTACGFRTTSDPDHLTCRWDDHGRETLVLADSMVGQFAIFGNAQRELGRAIMAAVERAGAWVLARPWALAGLALYLVAVCALLWRYEGTDGLAGLATLLVGAWWLPRMLRRR